MMLHCRDAAFARLRLLDRTADGGTAASPGTNSDATRLLSWKSPRTPFLALETSSVDNKPDEPVSL